MDPVLSVRKIGACFGKGAIFHEVSFEVFPGTVFVMVGPKSAGKSSVIRMICGLNIHQQGATFAGQILYEERPVSADWWPAMVVQKAHMVVGTVYQSLADKYGEENCGSEPDLRKVLGEHLEGLGLGELVGMMDEGVIGIGILRRKKLMIARAMLGAPGLICFTNPTVGLNEEESQDLLLFIRSLKSRCAVLMSLNNLDEVRLVADRVCLLAGGRIQECSDTEDFFERAQSPAARAFVQTGTCSVAPLHLDLHLLDPTDLFIPGHKEEVEISESSALPEISDTSEFFLGGEVTEPGLVTHMDAHEYHSVVETDSWVRTPTSIGVKSFRMENWDITEIKFDGDDDSVVFSDDD